FNSGAGTWQMSVPAGSWVAGARNYRITSQGVNQPDSLTENPGPNAIFIVDSQNPSGTITNPDSRAYRNSLPTLTATASDTAPGTVQSVVFRVARGEDATKLWNWQTSTFTVASGAATDLTATLNAGVWSYTTDYFQINTGTGAWQRGRSYVVHEIVTDKAGNFSDTAHPGFTFDIGVPTATIAVPVLASTSGLTALPSISGTIQDDYVAANAQIALQRQSDGIWFDGTNFTVSQGAPNFLSVTSLSSGATTWAFT